MFNNLFENRLDPLSPLTLLLQTCPDKRRSGQPNRESQFQSLPI